MGYEQKSPDRLRVRWTGSFFSVSSLAIVNRRLVGALLDRDNVEVALETEPLAADDLPEELRRFAARATFCDGEPHLTVAHRWPPRFEMPGAGRYVHVRPWEFGSMPVAWYEALRHRCDDLWTHTEYNRACYVEAGMPPERVAVVPHGVDPGVFRPDGPSAETARARFRFLFVGGTIPRKGIDVLVNAYARAFRPRDDVVLTIKDLSTSDYSGQTFAPRLRDLAMRRDVARIEYGDQTVPDASLAALYRAADCLVLPYRGEGFRLPVLEAMACGLPVIVTEGGATDDFVDETVGWRIPSRRRTLAPQHAPLPTVAPAWLLEPDVDALAELLRYVREHRDEARARGARGAERAHARWTWDRAAAVAEARFAEVAGREPLRAGTV